MRFEMGALSRVPGEVPSRAHLRFRIMKKHHTALRSNFFTATILPIRPYDRAVVTVWRTVVCDTVIPMPIGSFGLQFLPCHCYVNKLGGGVAHGGAPLGLRPVRKWRILLLSGGPDIAESTIFWDILIRLIEEGNVVPVVGQDLLTMPGCTGAMLYPFLASELAAYLGVSNEDLAHGGELNDVACRFLSQGGQIEDIYPALKTITAPTESLPIPVPLLQLAEIRPLRLFVTTTFDSFLARALNRKRFGDTSGVRVFAYSPNQVEDLPPDYRSFAWPAAYHLFGRVSATPAYAVTQEDVVEFFHALQSETRQPKALFDELNRGSLLIIGSRFSGWLTRFFMRMPKASRLSVGGKSDYLVDAEVSGDPSLVMFLKHFSKATKIFGSGNPVEFVAELHRRWMERHATDAESAASAAPAADSQAEVETGAVFLSYASGDAAAVESIRQALESAGVDVFFDKADLQPGNDWEATLRRRIHQCSIFVPVISRQTLTPDRRFFRAEWKLALREAEMAPFSDEDAFLLPVVIDDTPADEPAIPSEFRAVQWCSLQGGRPTDAFVARVQQLYRKHQKMRMGSR
jgi:hypothetical protein